MQNIDQNLASILRKIALPNQTLSPTTPISKQFCQLGINDLHTAIAYVNKLHYAAPTEPFNWKLVLPQQCGTCSTKHALLSALCKELKIPCELGHAIFNMSAENFPMLSDVLKTTGLEYIPESHNFLVYKNNFLDITFPGAAKILNSSEISQVQTIKCEDLPTVKQNWYPQYLQEWLQKNKPHMTLDEYAKVHRRIVECLGDVFL